MCGMEAERGRHSRGAVELVQGEEGGGDEKFEQAGERREPRRGPGELHPGLPKQVKPQATALFQSYRVAYSSLPQSSLFIHEINGYLRNQAQKNYKIF